MLRKSLTDWLVVVPARLASTRLPDKPILDLAGKPLIVRVYENLGPLIANGAVVVVAVDDERVATVCRDHAIPHMMTSRDHATGTDRCAEVAARQSEARPYILNIQGDEPFLAPNDLMRLCGAFAAQKSQTSTMSTRAPMASMYLRSHDAQRFIAPSCVKVVCSPSGHALYFSRSPIPHDRDHGGKLAGDFLVHMGVYAFDREALKLFCALPPSPLEATEKLEQLRALEAGWKILMQEASAESLGIDTPADLEAARVRFR